MKRQNSSTALSSSSYRGTINSSSSASETNNLRAESVGCMSGIIQLVCKYQNRRKFLITFGKKQEKNIIVASSPLTKRSAESPTKSQERRDTRRDVVSRSPDEQQPRRLSCEAPVRSPTIPPEIRRSNSVNSTENFLSSAATPPPSLVARLMGLSGEPIVIPSESASEKRRKLLGALEKCDQDLRALKKIIDAVCSSEMESRRPDPAAGADGKGCDDQEQPSPVSVLDELIRSPCLTRCMKRQPSERNGQHQQQQIKAEKLGEFEGANSSPVISLCERIKHSIAESLPPPARRWSISSPLPLDHHDHHRHGVNIIESSRDSLLKRMIFQGMKESVEQVCRDVEWGERREAGRIGLFLQDRICRDLIEETVKELGLSCNSLTPVLPRFEACKRRLCF